MQDHQTTFKTHGSDILAVATKSLDALRVDITEMETRMKAKGVSAADMTHFLEPVVAAHTTMAAMIAKIKAAM